ncbi:MAG: rhodanese-like domain-containing protein [Myxococcales bacterium]|nr:rhodanese-like domain-containing protein [Myxococcales bacterium]
MRSFLLAAALAATTLAACEKSDRTTDTAAAKSIDVPEVTVEQLDQQLAAKTAQAVDANGPATRKKLGVIPGAIMLPDTENWSPSELPSDKDKPLVFYCSNSHCDASHEAAGKALNAGYKNVKVLPEGIAGWVKAGKKVQSI